MLTKELAISRYDFRRGQLIPDRLTTGEHGHYVGFAEQMLEIYRDGRGVRRRDLHRRIQAIFSEEPECPQRRIDAFCKLLDDVSVYEDAGRRDAPKLRRQVFRLAATHHPLVTHADRLFERSATDVHRLVAAATGRPWSEIENELFADVMEFHRLESFEDYPQPRALLSRYNVAQVQVALYSALTMTVTATTGFKRILRAARLAKLMHTVNQTGPGVYSLRFDGPASVLRETRRYGIQMAKFLPALIGCEGWKMHAVIETRSRHRLSLDLSEADRLQSHLPPDSEFDSSVEADFAAKWGPEPRDGWTLEREGEFLYVGQKTFVPDFVCRHRDGRTVLMEIIGFWTPEYLQSRLETVQIFRDCPILFAVQEGAKDEFQKVVSRDRVIPYKTALLIKPVLESLQRFV